MTLLVGEALAWCRSVLGPVEVLADCSKEHGGHASGTWRLRTNDGHCYLKVHQTPSTWRNEVHAYERWARAFGERAPRLLAVRDVEPLALIVSELPGRTVEGRPLSSAQERAIWRAAGAALIALHDLGVGDCFGPCQRDGACAAGAPREAVPYVGDALERSMRRAARGGYVTEAELATVQAALALLPMFAGEPAVPCHRDYCAANWLVTPDGALSGIIDFEFAYWDVRVTDFSRDPDWTWVLRRDLMEAFWEGYGRSLTPAEEQQLLVTRTAYALDAVVWGRDYAYYGFEREGRVALAHLAPLVGA